MLVAGDAFVFHWCFILPGEHNWLSLLSFGVTDFITSSMHCGKLCMMDKQKKYSVLML